MKDWIARLSGAIQLSIQYSAVSCCGLDANEGHLYELHVLCYSIIVYDTARIL